MDPKAEMKMPSARIMTPFKAGPVPPMAIADLARSVVHRKVIACQSNAARDSFTGTDRCVPASPSTMGNMLPVLAAFLTAAATLLCGCGNSLAREVSARVLKADGLNFVTEPKQGSERAPIEGKIAGNVGETIHSGSDGSVALSLLPGALLQLEPNSTLQSNS